MKTKLTKIKTNFFFNSSTFWILLVSPFVIILLIIFITINSPIKADSNQNLINIQKSWKEDDVYRATSSSSKEKFYCLSMCFEALKSIILFDTIIIRK